MNTITYTRTEIENMITDLDYTIKFRRELYLKEGNSTVRTMIQEAIERQTYLSGLIADSTIQTVEL